MTESVPPAHGPTPGSVCRRGAGIVALLLLAGTHVAPLRTGGRAAYLDAGLATVAAAALLTAGLLAARDTRWDWYGAGLLAAAALAGYLVSRGIGWPGASTVVGHWRSPAGTAAVAADLLTLAVVAAGPVSERHAGAARTEPGRPPGPSPRTRP
ncbi:MAG TPA: hypothetical protein VGP36_15755 [Mycobacteriales bacterium]|nr:hypothetical protein [Mycobacteriales bacterium]